MQGVAQARSQRLGQLDLFDASVGFELKRLAAAGLVRVGGTNATAQLEKLAFFKGIKDRLQPKPRGRGGVERIMGVMQGAIERKRLHEVLQLSRKICNKGG
jgi:hypothetical protein